MIRKILTVILLLLTIPCFASADDSWIAQDEDINLYYYEKIYQSGNLPNSEFNGIKTYSISWVDSTECFGNSNAPADSVLYLGYVETAEEPYRANGPCKIIIRIDDLSLPTHAIIDKATLYLKGSQISAVSGTHPDTIFANRMLANSANSPTDSLTWNLRFANAAGTDSNSGRWRGYWTGNNAATRSLRRGASDSTCRFGTTTYFGSTNASSWFRSRLNSARPTTVPRQWYSDEGINIPVPGDTLYSSYSTSATVSGPSATGESYSCDSFYEPIAMHIVSESALTALGFDTISYSLVLNATDFIKNWESGLWANFGILIRSSKMYNETALSDYAFISSSAIEVKSRPILMVRYYSPVLDASGSGGRLIGTVRGFRR